MQHTYTPNWYMALQCHAWTVRNILREFAVAHAIARDWQQNPPSYLAARAQERAHQELITQVGH